MIDTHCHLDLPAFDADRAMVLARSRQAGVGQWVVPGVRLAAFPALLALRSPDLQVALGLHPLLLEEHPADAVAQLAQWLERTEPAAIGEVGLDFMVPAAAWAAQEELFEAQLQLARRYRLPLLLHVRKAHDPLLARLRRAPPVGGIVHAFNGSLVQARCYLELGFKLGFGGVVTYPRATRIRRLAAELPVSALVLESDAPDLPPLGHRGERNEPCHLPQVAATVAGLRGMPVAQLIAATTANARAVLPEVGR